MTDINAKIRAVNRVATAGPPTTLAPFDVDEVVARWRADRADRAGGPDRAGDPPS